MPSKARIQITADRKKQAQVFTTELARQRVIINEEFTTKTFQYKLSDFPPAFLHNGQMREAAKHCLYSTCADGWIVEEHTLVEPNAVTVYDSGVFPQNLVIIWMHGKIQQINHPSYNTAKIKR